MSAYIGRVRPPAITFRPASDKQLSLIARLLDEKQLEAEDREAIENDIANGLSTRGASTWIDFLFGRKRLPAQQVLAVDVVARERVSEEGFYKADDGDVYKVVRTKDGERLYAKKSTASGWDWESGKGMMRKLFADQKLTGEQIAALGITFGFCIVCSTEFSDPTSKHIGIGPKCGADQLGVDAYKALRLTVADRPDVIAFEAAKKAAAKERREAKKREEAQLQIAV